MSLENRAYLLSMNYLDIGVEEEASAVIGMGLIKKANSEMLATYSLA